MTNQNTADGRTVKLTVAQISVLLTAVSFLSCGEWDETITTAQKNTLDRAEAKLRAALKASSVQRKVARDAS